MVGIAQLVRASICGVEGREFESHFLPNYGWCGVMVACLPVTQKVGVQIPHRPQKTL